MTAAPLPEGLTPEEKRDIEVFRRAQASVVFITSVALRRDIFSFDAQQIPQGTGSGIVWDRQGHIVTNFHVIQDGTSGRVIGVNAAIFSPSGASAGIGFAVPVDTISRLVPQLIARGRAIEAGIGVTLIPTGTTPSSASTAS